MYPNHLVSGQPLANVAVSTAAAASTSIIAAKNGYFIRVISGTLISAGTTDLTIEHGDGTNVTGAMSLTAQVGFNIPECAAGAFDIPTGQSLNILLSQAVQVSGWLRYQYVKNPVS